MTGPRKDDGSPSEFGAKGGVPGLPKHASPKKDDKAASPEVSTGATPVRAKGEGGSPLPPQYNDA